MPSARAIDQHEELLAPREVGVGLAYHARLAWRVVLDAPIHAQMLAPALGSAQARLAPAEAPLPRTDGARSIPIEE